MNNKKPYLNITRDAEYSINDDGNFKEEYFSISDRVGAQRLGYNVVILQPGFKACPFHNHHVNEEMFLVLSGNGTLRYGPNKYPIEKDDIIACPPGGREVAHQIVNSGSVPLKILCVSTNEIADVCEYPDSDKAMSLVGKQGSRSFSHIYKLDEKIDYFEGER